MFIANTISGVRIIKRILNLPPHVTENLAISFAQASLILVWRSCTVRSWQRASLDIILTKANKKKTFWIRSGDLGGQFLEPPCPIKKKKARISYPLQYGSAAVHSPVETSSVELSPAVAELRSYYTCNFFP